MWCRSPNRYTLLVFDTLRLVLIRWARALTIVKKGKSHQGGFSQAPVQYNFYSFFIHTQEGKREGVHRKLIFKMDFYRYPTNVSFFRRQRPKELSYF